MLGFVRVTTNRRVVAWPPAVKDVMERPQSWLKPPHVHVAQPSDNHFALLRAELERLGTAGNLTTDAHLAVLAMQRGYVLYSTDTDFARFKRLRRVNPRK
jgi:uncharacterized protein